MKNKITKKSTIRDIMQVLGTDLLRQGFNNNIHVAATLGSIKENEKAIITDVRFPNEAKAVKDKGGIMIRVNRPHYGTSMVDLANAHESETALDIYEDWDYIIDNDSDILTLSEKIRLILVDMKLL